MCENGADNELSSRRIVTGPTLASTFCKLIKWVSFLSTSDMLHLLRQSNKTVHVLSQENILVV